MSSCSPSSEPALWKDRSGSGGELGDLRQGWAQRGLTIAPQLNVGVTEGGHMLRVPISWKDISRTNI